MLFLPETFFSVLCGNIIIGLYCEYMLLYIVGHIPLSEFVSICNKNKATKIK